MAPDRADERDEGVQRKRSVARFGPLDGTRVVIDDPATLKALYDPLRFQIVGLLSEPRSVKEVARSLGRKPSGLYHHVKLLEDRGLVRVAEERVVARRIERLYVRAASEFETAEELGGVMAGLVGNRTLGSAVGHLRRALRPEGADPRVRFVADYTTRLTSAEAEELAGAIRTFLDDAMPGHRDGHGSKRRPASAVEYRLIVSMAPAEDEADADDADDGDDESDGAGPRRGR